VFLNDIEFSDFIANVDLGENRRELLCSDFGESNVRLLVTRAAGMGNCASGWGRETSPIQTLSGTVSVKCTCGIVIHPNVFSPHRNQGPEYARAKGHLMKYTSPFVLVGRATD
jgi:hypothetical protein